MPVYFTLLALFLTLTSTQKAETFGQIQPNDKDKIIKHLYLVLPPGQYTGVTAKGEKCFIKVSVILTDMEVEVGLESGEQPPISLKLNSSPETKIKQAFASGEEFHIDVDENDSMTSTYRVARLELNSHKGFITRLSLYKSTSFFDQRQIECLLHS